MNAKDRARLSRIIDVLQVVLPELEELKDAEREKFDNMSDGLQQSERGQAIDAAASELENAHTDLENTINTLEGML